jgi:hypothetical protein
MKRVGASMKFPANAPTHFSDRELEHRRHDRFYGPCDGNADERIKFYARNAKNRLCLEEPTKAASKVRGDVSRGAESRPPSPDLRRRAARNFRAVKAGVLYRCGDRVLQS